MQSFIRGFSLRRENVFVSIYESTQEDKLS